MTARSLLIVALLVRMAEAQTPPPAATPDAGVPQRSLLAPDPDAPTLTTRLEKYKVAFGEPAVLILHVIHRRGVSVNLPTTPDLGPFGILQTIETSKDLADGNVLHEFKLKLLPYDVGRLVVPPLEVVYLNTAGQYRTLHSDGVSVDVGSLIANEPEPKLKDDTRPVTVFEDDYTLLWIVGGAAAVLLIIAVTLLIAKQVRRRAKALAPGPPPRPADEVALERLAKLAASGLAKAEDLQPYYLELSEIVRGYLGGRFGFDSLELTTTELTDAMKRHLPDEDQLSALQAWLEDCDLVKFAKVKVDSDEAEAAYAQAHAFVLATRPRPPEPVVATTGAAGPPPPVTPPQREVPRGAA